jgi:hypothetical protein
VPTIAGGSVARRFNLRGNSEDFTSIRKKKPR